MSWLPSKDIPALVTIIAAISRARAVYGAAAAVRLSKP